METTSDPWGPAEARGADDSGAAGTWGRQGVVAGAHTVPAFSAPKPCVSAVGPECRLSSDPEVVQRAACTTIGHMASRTTEWRLDQLGGGPSACQVSRGQACPGRGAGNGEDRDSRRARAEAKQAGLRSPGRRGPPGG